MKKLLLTVALCVLPFCLHAEKNTVTASNEATVKANSSQDNAQPMATTKKKKSCCCGGKKK